VSGRRLVTVVSRGRVCVLTLDREEKLNAISSELERHLAEALDSPEVRESACVVIAGGPRAFSSGADVDELRGRTTADVLAYYRDTGSVYERVAQLEQPTVAAISGYCLGGGLELALATDLRIAEETAILGFPEVGLGILPSSGGTHRVVRLLGPARAKELVLLGERVDGRRAHELGLVTDVVPEGGALDRALEVAERLAALPPLALSVAKQSIDRMPESSREAGILLERLAYAVLAQTDEARGIDRP
jgi:enoyl-CoA hydratase/carnithine racemase